MGLFNISRALLLALALSAATALTALTAADDDSDCALYLSGPGRSTAYDYTLNLLKGNFAYEGQHTCITYDAVNQAYLEARNRIAVSQPKGEWKAEDFASVGELILDISINLARRYGLTYEEIEKGLPLIDTSRTLIRDVCPPVFSHVECRAGKYRRLDGLCNNLEHPTWGSTMAPFQRLIGPLFADGINAPRIAHTGNDLPLSRVVSRTMHPDEGYHDHAGTVMVIAWGQFMDHDYTLTGTPLDPINRNDPEECCSRPQHLKHPYCNEIRIPDDDYFYRLWGVKCIDFVRAFPSPRPGCRLGSRVPFNTLTGALDGNTVYGVTDKFSRKLRTGYGGLLRMNPVFKEYGLKDLLPLKLDIPDEGCTRPNKNMYCFEGGEIRVNEQLVLTVMHTLMAREHNRVAKALAAVNPHWDDETLFQETRRINIAEIQHITYNEFLPILLGKDVMEKFGLVLEKEGYWDGYDPTVNPDVIDAFASAAFRFGHSLLPTAVERWSKAHKFIASKRLSDLIRRPYDLYRAGVLDEYVMGLMNQVAQAMDDSITQEVTNHLFKKIGARFGMDLVSFNMQRGREFGIPGYMEFRKFCGLHGADTFQDLFGSMPNETVRKYETIFEHPVDVDLWSGGVSERPLPGSMLGPTFACVIATQFSYSRRGDRFWFELPNQPSSFTPEQLHELRKARLSRVICDNTDIIDTVQLYPMVLPDHELNPRVPCRSGIIPSMDFSKWAEPAPFHGPKPFITEAHLAIKNVTENTTEIHETKDGVRVDNSAAQAKENDKLNATLELHVNCENVTGNNCTDSVNNCSECANKVKEIQRIDTILKHLSKNDGNTTLGKATGHPRNSLRRRKRSANDTIDVQPAASAPLIVNYVTSHDPRPFAPKSANIIQSGNLADFHIETIHDAPLEQNDKSQHKSNINDENISKSEELNKSEEIEHLNRIKANADSSEKDDSKSNERKLQNSEESHESSRPKLRKNDSSGERSDEISDDHSEEQRQRDNYKSERRGNVPYKEIDSREQSSDSNEHDKSRESIPHDSREEKDYLKRQSSHEGNHDKSEQSDERQDSRERSSDRNRGDDRSHSSYKRDQSNESNDSREKTSNDGSYENKEHLTPYHRRKNNNHKDSRERSDYRNRENSLGRENENSQEDTLSNLNYYKAPNKAKYRASPPDSNEGREQTDDAPFSQRDGDEKSYNRHENNPDYSKSRDQSSGSRENSDSKEFDNSFKKKLHQVNNQDLRYGNSIKPIVQQPPKPSESEEQEAIIAFLKKKNFPKPGDELFESNAPLVNKNIDLTYKRIKINDRVLLEPVKNTNQNYKKQRLNNPEHKHIQETEDDFSVKSQPMSDFHFKDIKEKEDLVKPVKKTHESYAKLPVIDVPLIEPLSTLQPIVVQEESNEQLAKSSADVPVNNESSEENDESVPIDDGEVKPVVEINPEPELEISKESLKADPNEDNSLEALLGIKNLNSDEKNDKLVEQNEGEENKGDVKEQFERIPLNYKHDEKQQKDAQHPNSEKKAQNNDNANLNQGTLDILTPPVQDPRYDEHLNFKFGDVSIKLPEIKLPDDILDVSYHSDDYKKSPYNDDDIEKSPYEEKRKKKKNKNEKPEKPFFHYNEQDYKEEDPHKHDDVEHRDIRDPNHDDNGDHNDHHNREHAEEHDHGYQDYYPKKKEKEDYKSKHGQDADDEGEEDLYEKFVRERFGKKGTSEKRSEKLETRPALDNAKLFQSLQNVLQKANNIDKEAEKSGDPNAGYMWTLEYGQDLH